MGKQNTLRLNPSDQERRKNPDVGVGGSKESSGRGSDDGIGEAADEGADGFNGDDTPLTWAEVRVVFRFTVCQVRCLRFTSHLTGKHVVKLARPLNLSSHASPFTGHPDRDCPRNASLTKGGSDHVHNCGGQQVHTGRRRSALLKSCQSLFRVGVVFPLTWRLALSPHGTLFTDGRFYWSVRRSNFLVCASRQMLRHLLRSA